MPFSPALSGNYEVILAVDATAPTVIGFAPYTGQAGVGEPEHQRHGDLQRGNERIKYQHKYDAAA